MLGRSCLGTAVLACPERSRRGCPRAQFGPFASSGRERVHSCRMKLQRERIQPLKCTVPLSVREDRGDGTGAGLAGRFCCKFCCPGGRVKMFDKHLVYAIIDGKDPDCGSAELSVNLGLTCGHRSLLLTYDTSGPSAIFGAFTETSKGVVRFTGEWHDH
jgi:hypothetical protein